MAATAYAAFSGGETVGRLLSDPVVARVGWVRAVRTGAALCVPVFTAALVLGRPWPALVAFGICGAAISTVFPAAFAAAGRVGSVSPAVAMAQVGFAGNMGWLAVSPAIGAMAAMAGLLAALALLPLAAAAIAVMAPAVRPAENSIEFGTEWPAPRADPAAGR
jgi:fucose permease